MMAGQYDALVEEIVRAVQARQTSDQPRALLIGTAPPIPTSYQYVSQPPYVAVVIGSLSIGALLHFSHDDALQALLEGKPVLLWQGGLPHRQHAGCTNRALHAQCLRAERQLTQLGVRILGQTEGRHLITAQQARQLQGAPIPPGSVLTPLARDILEGKA